jgi:hypothetical protein
MKKLFLSMICLVSVILLMAAGLPKGWRKAGTMPDSYEMVAAHNEGRDGKTCATIRSLSPKISGFGSLMQYIVPGKFAGQKVRLSAWIRSKDVEGAAGLWLRVDKEINRSTALMENMEKNPIKGTTEWRKYQIVADVPEFAAGIAYGVLLSGTGQMWIDDVEIEIVEQKPLSGKISAEPSNLSFEE